MGQTYTDVDDSRLCHGHFGHLGHNGHICPFLVKMSTSFKGDDNLETMVNITIVFFRITVMNVFY